jgi:hypothetical protein
MDDSKLKEELDKLEKENIRLKSELVVGGACWQRR